MKLGRQRGEHFLGVVSDPLALCAGLKNSTAGLSSGARAQCPGGRWTSSPRELHGFATPEFALRSLPSLLELELQHLHLAALDGDEATLTLVAVGKLDLVATFVERNRIARSRPDGFPVHGDLGPLGHLEL